MGGIIHGSLFYNLQHGYTFPLNLTRHVSFSFFFSLCLSCLNFEKANEHDNQYQYCLPLVVRYFAATLRHRDRPSQTTQLMVSDILE
jgi:hypothetical protein